MAEEILGVPNDEQALAAVGGGDKAEYTDAEKDRISQQIQDSAAANAQWRASLPFDQQLILANTPIVSYPPGFDEPVTTEAVSAEPQVNANAGV